MKKAVFWEVAPCAFIINQRFRGTCRLHLQGRINNTKKWKVLDSCKQTEYSSKTVRTSSKMSVYNKPTWHHIPEDGILQSDCCLLPNACMAYFLNLKMEAVHSSKLSVNIFSNLHGITSQKTECFIVTAMKTSKPSLEHNNNNNIGNSVASVRVVSATGPHDRILDFLDHSHYYFFQAAPQLYSRG
jgi:hypothetical protein